MSKERKIGAILSYVAIVVNIIIQLLYTPFLIRSLGQSEYGLYSLVASIIGYLTILDLGFGNAIIVYTAKYKAQNMVDEEKKLHGMFNVIFKIIGVIAALIGIALYFNVNTIFGSNMTNIELEKMKTMMIILSFNLFISFSFAIYSSIIRANERFIFKKIVSLIHAILTPLIMIPLLFLGYKSISLCCVITFTNFALLLTDYYYCRKKLGIKIKYCGFDGKIFKIIIGYSIWIFIATVVDKVNWSVDNFILGAVSGTIAVSIYALAATINQLFINLSTAISSVLLPKISKMVAKNASNEELTNEFIKVGRLQYLIIFLMASGLVLVGKEFFILWAGNGYSDAYYIAMLLILPLCIPLIQNLGLSIMQAKNMFRFRSLLLLCISAVNIIVSIPLSKTYGGIGAAFGTGASLLIGNGLILNCYYYKKVGLNIPKFWKEIIKMTIPFVIPILLIVVFMHFLELKGILSILIYGGIYTVIYCLVAYYFSMNEYEKNVVKKFMRKIHLSKN